MKDYIGAGKHPDTGLYHAYLFINHPTPSGCDRPILNKSTKKGYKSGWDAIDAMVSMLDPDYVKTIDVPTKGEEIK